VHYANDYVGNYTDYVIKTRHSFVDYLLEYITMGIYTPTSTTYYVPLNK
jgi:hypothetical protein